MPPNCALSVCRVAFTLASGSLRPLSLSSRELPSLFNHSVTLLLVNHSNKGCSSVWIDGELSVMVVLLLLVR